jgi:biotin-dependent carboxylase-like uncharacterized protein
MEVVSPGPLTTVQDLGRPGLAELGVGASGAADRRSLRLANRLVANPEGAAGLELTMGGLHARFTTPATIAVTGAPCPLVVCGRGVAMLGPFDVPAGAELVVGAPACGLRTYLAVRGGVAVRPVLGSRSTDVLAHIGPPVVAAGDLLPIGPEPSALPHVDVAVVPPLPNPVVLTVSAGPRDDWFDAGALDVLCSRPYVVQPDSNRIGIRLAGPQLVRRTRQELPSEGVVLGAVQVSSEGQPVVFLADHPVTGGYPVIAVVDEDEVDLAAQARPGDRISFRVEA